MGHAARRNQTSQAASRGLLLSRQTIMGAMDRALEMHASALRILEARIVGLKARIEKMEIMLHVEPGEALTRHVQDAAVSGIVTRPSQSAQPCGCDLGASWICLQHAQEKIDNADAHR